MIDLLTDVDPLTGEILPDPDALAAVQPLFDGLVGAVENFSNAVQSLSQDDVRSTFDAIGRSVETLGDIAGKTVLVVTELIATVDRFVQARRGVASIGGGLAGDAPTDGSGSGRILEFDENLNLIGETTKGAQEEVDKLGQSFRKLANTASLAARGGLAEQEKALKSLEQISNRAATGSSLRGGRTSGAAQGRIEQIVSERLVQLGRERASILTTVAGLQKQSADNLRIISQLSQEDVSRASFIAQQARTFNDLLSEQSRIQTKINLEDEIRKKALQNLDNEAAKAAQGRLEAAQEELAVNQSRLDSVEASARAVASNADQQDRVNGLLERAFGLSAAQASQQVRLNDLVRQEAQLRERAAEANVRASIGQSTQALTQEVSAQTKDETSLLKQQEQIQATLIRLKDQSAASTQDELASNRLSFEVERRRLQLELRKASLLQGIDQIRQRANNQLERAANLEAGQQRDNLTATANESLRLADERVARAQQLSSEQDEVTRGLNRQAALQRLLVQQGRDRAETARLEGQLTQTTRGNTGGAAGGFSAIADDATQGGQALGQVLSNALTLSPEEREEIISSYDNLFERIGAGASKILRKTSSVGGAPRAAGAIFAPIGVFNQAAGFAQGGRIPNTRSASPSAAHFFAGGLASGGQPLRPAGLHHTDTVPIWAAPGEFMQPVSAVQKYGPQVMEAIRRGSIDPMSLRALAGAGRSVRRPRTGGFQTGGEVLSTDSPSGSEQTGPSRAFIVSSEDQLDNLMAGSGEAFLRFAAYNREDVRSALGL